MKLVTETFQKYRQIARSIWNDAFWLNDDLATWDGREEFDEICRLLFRAIVRAEFGDDHVRFLVSPRSTSGVPVQIEQPRPNDKNHYWDHPITRLNPNEAVLEFEDYFDWDCLGFLDFKFVRAKIRSFPSATELVGRHVLIEADYVEIEASVEGENAGGGR